MHLPGNGISATVALVCINVQPVHELLARLISDNSRSLEKLELGVLSSQPLPKETILHGV